MKKKHPEHVNLERWLVSYADFITLLFAFFVVMYAISQADMNKLKAVAEGMRSAFGKSGPVGVVELKGKGSGSELNVFDTPQIAGGRMMDMPAGKVNVAADADPELQGLKDLLEESISLQLGVADPSQTVQMTYDRMGLVIRLSANGLFRDGEVEVVPPLRPVLNQIGKVVAKTSRLVRVEGHTAPTEFVPAQFKSAWEFSAARAAWVIQDWIAKFKVDPKRLTASGNAHYRPIKTGKGVWDTMSNRRIEVIILNQKYEAQ